MLENFRLRVFRAVAEHLNFRKAGESLYLTQPAVTLQIKALEEELGTRLFQRGASGVRLSEAGRILVPYAEQLSRITEEAENSLARLKGDAAGHLALGASTTIAQYILPRPLAQFAGRFPAIQLQVFSENSEQIAAGVSSGRFGLGLIEGPAMRNDLKVEAWFEDELFLAVPQSHEWAQAGVVAAAQLVDVPLVMRERGSGSRHVVEQALQKAGLRLGALRIAMELDSTEAILSCVENGLGLGFASEWAMQRRLLAGSLAALRLEGQRMNRRLSFVLPQGPDTNPAALTMRRFLENSVPLLKGR
jgi:DNA-binding transcriptional LysR family regulator